MNTFYIFSLISIIYCLDKYRNYKSELYLSDTKSSSSHESGLNTIKTQSKTTESTGIGFVGGQLAGRLYSESENDYNSQNNTITTGQINSSAVFIKFSLFLFINFLFLF